MTMAGQNQQRSQAPIDQARASFEKAVEENDLAGALEIVKESGSQTVSVDGQDYRLEAVHEGSSGS